MMKALDKVPCNISFKCSVWTALDLLLILSLVLVLIAVNKWISMGEIFFLCQDQSIRYPYRKETISQTFLFLAGSVVPVTLFYVIEMASESHRAHKDYICVSVTEVVRISILYTFGAAVTLVFTYIGKITTQRLQPSFLDTCKPNFAQINCIDGYRPVNISQCLNERVAFWEIESSFQSFPSQHAAFSSYSMVYLVIYLQARLKVTFSTLFRPLLQSMALSVAYYFALTRVADYKHHWSDVLAGSMLGILVAFYTAMKVTRLFYKPKSLPFDAPEGNLADNTREVDEHTHLFTNDQEHEDDHCV